MGRGGLRSSVPGRGADAVMPGGPRWGGSGTPPPPAAAPSLLLSGWSAKTARRVAGWGGPGPFREPGDGTCRGRGAAAEREPARPSAAGLSEERPRPERAETGAPPS